MENQTGLLVGQDASAVIMQEYGCNKSLAIGKAIEKSCGYYLTINFNSDENQISKVLSESSSRIKVEREILRKLKNFKIKEMVSKATAALLLSLFSSFLGFKSSLFQDTSSGILLLFSFFVICFIILFFGLTYACGGMHDYRYYHYLEDLGLSVDAKIWPHNKLGIMVFNEITKGLEKRTANQAANQKLIR